MTDYKNILDTWIISSKNNFDENMIAVSKCQFDCFDLVTNAKKYKELTDQINQLESLRKTYSGLIFDKSLNIDILNMSFKTLAKSYTQLKKDLHKIECQTFEESSKLNIGTI